MAATSPAELPLTEIALPYRRKLVRRPVVPMFAEPDPLSEQVSQALLAMPALELEARDDWRRIQTWEGYQGWVEAEGLCDFPEGWSEPWCEVTDLYVNLRAQPSSTLTAVTHAMVGTRLPRLERRDRWAEVLLPDGRRVWTEAHRVTDLPAAEGELRPPTPRAITATARRFLNVPYLWGGCSVLGLDCSGFVQLVMRLHGIPLLRDAYQQAEQGTAAPDPDIADLVFFGPEDQPEKITHVGMMLDRKRFIHAAGSDRVRINRLTDRPYDARYRFARRLIGDRS